MKRILLVAVVFLLAGVLFAQQTGGGSLPSSSQVKDTARQFSSQAKTNSSQFQSTLAELTARNTGNKDLETFNRLKAEIEHLESRINTEEGRVRGSLEKGQRLTNTSLERIDSLIQLHQAKVAELDAFISG